MEAARNGRIDEVNAAALSDDLSCFGASGSPTWVGEVYAVESKREGILIRDVSPEEAVDQLMRFLESRGVFDDDANIKAASKARQPRVSASSSAPVLTVAEILSDRLRSVSLELLGGAAAIAQGLGTRAEAVLIGHSVSDHVHSLTDHGADRVYLADHPVFAGYDTEVYAHALCEAIAEAKPCAVLMASTTQGRDLAGRVAGRLRLGLTGDCIGLELDAEKRLVQLKPAFGGNIVAPILSKTRPDMATVRPGILEPLIPVSGIEPLITYLPLQNMPVRKVEVIEHVIDESIQGAELENASVIVGVGMGIGGPENLGPVRELADALSAPIGATRDVTDQGWMPRQYQIGVSGKSVSPALYIAVALRGPFNHSVGIKRAGTVVAINNNRRAAIFREADFGILGDYAEIVPVLTRAIRTRLSK
jgi:electron transfer flavoprotein alpha subunit